MNDTTASDCTCPSALTASVAELDAFLDGDCVEPLTLAQSEAAALVLQELKRRMQATPAAPGIDLPGWAFERPDGSDLIVISAPNGRTWVTEPDDRLHMLATAVIDASPKGGSDVAARVLDALRSAEGLAMCCLAVDGYSRREIEQMARATAPTFTAAIKTLQATSAEVGA